MSVVVICTFHLKDFNAREISGMTSRMTRPVAFAREGFLSIFLLFLPRFGEKFLVDRADLFLVNCFRRLMWPSYVKELLRSAVEEFISCMIGRREVWHDGYFLRGEIRELLASLYIVRLFRDMIYKALISQWLIFIIFFNL